MEREAWIRFIYQSVEREAGGAPPIKKGSCFLALPGAPRQARPPPSCRPRADLDFVDFEPHFVGPRPELALPAWLRPARRSPGHAPFTELLPPMPPRPTSSAVFGAPLAQWSAGCAAAGAAFLNFQFKEFNEVPFSFSTEAVFSLLISIESLHAQHVSLSCPLL